MNLTCILTYKLSRVHVQYKDLCDCHNSPVSDANETKLCV